MVRRSWWSYSCWSLQARNAVVEGWWSGGGRQGCRVWRAVVAG
ncbi:hypothetical protein AB0N14_01305 [Streptomyces sp. NPDC051104]